MNGEYNKQYEGEDYADLIVFYQNNPQRLSKYKGSAINYMNQAFAVVHVPVSQISMKTVNPFGYANFPKLYGLTSEVSIEASGVDKLRAFPNFNLRGNGVLIGLIDTGIDYTNPVFIKAVGNTKIVSIWDQSIDTDPAPYNYTFGTEYLSEQINTALSSTNPYDIVPSRDETGHGTMMAAISAGNEVPDHNFTGVVPDAELIIVKLRQAKKYLRDFYVIPDNTLCYQENDIMWGVQYCVQKASELNRPIVICTGTGTSQGSHNGRSFLSTFMSLVGDFPRTAVVVPVGNEGARRRHYYGTIDPAIGFNTVELIVGENENGFSMELWGNAPGLYSIDITSPSGEFIPRLSLRVKENNEIRFIFEKTIINIDFEIAEALTGEELILLRFRNVASGSWRFNVYGLNSLSTGFHIWLPMGDFISTNTYFVIPDISVTVLDPGSSTVPISTTAYNIINDILYSEASRGYTRINEIKPELAAPGVNYVAPNQNNEYVGHTGTSVAAAHTAGLVAIILEWAVVRGNRPDIDTLAVKNYLIRGAKQSAALTYPNKDWGYGIVDIYNSYNTLRTGPFLE